MTQTKVCSKCSVEQPTNSYCKSKVTKDLLSAWCKSCQKDYRLANKEKHKVYFAEHYQDNKEKKNKQSSEYAQKNRQKINAYSREYAKIIRHKRCAYAMKRYATKKSCTPDWLTEQQLKEIENYYWLAADLRSVTGQEYHVDHIVPIQGENVCGLHVPWNLQVLPSDINISKSNFYNGW